MSPLDSIAANGRRLILACVLALALGTAPSFLRTFVNDDATYVLVAQKLNAGALLYRDAVDNKPPLIYATFAIAFRLLGTESVGAVKLLTLAVQLGCAALLFLIGRNLFGRRVGALAALFFSLAIVSGVAEDFIAPNTEAYMNLFGLGALWTLTRRPDRPTPLALALAGALAGIAALYRLQGTAVLLGALLFVLRRRRTGLPVVRTAALLGVGFAVPFAGVAGYFSARGTLPDLWRWAVLDNFSYVQLGAVHFGWRALGRIALVAVSQLPLLAAGVPAGAAWLRTPEPDRTRLELVWLQLLGGVLAYQTGTRFYGHYFQQIVPHLALIAAWGCVRLPGGRWPWLRLTPLLLVVWLLGFAGANTVRLWAADDDPAVGDAVAHIRAATGPRDEVFLWSAPARLSYESDRRFATRFAFSSHLTGRIFGTELVLPGATREAARSLESPEAWRLLDRDLTARAPAVIVDGGAPGFAIGRYPYLQDYVRRLYEPPVRFGTLDVYVRQRRNGPAHALRAYSAAPWKNSGSASSSSRPGTSRSRWWPTGP